MALKWFAEEASRLVFVLPVIVYALMLLDSPNIVILLVTASIFFSFIPHYLAEKGLGRRQISLLGMSPMTSTPLLLFLVCFVGAVFLLWFEAPPRVIAFSVAVASGEYLVALIRESTRWKISLHGQLSAASLTALTLSFNFSIILSLAIFVFFGWTRVYLKAHTPMQYLLGGALGYALTHAALASVGL